MADKVSHWEGVYQTKNFDSVSWYAQHLETSLKLIEELAPSKQASIIDVGGGQSTLVDDLLARGYENLTVLDISSAAIEFTQKRLGKDAGKINWCVGDITEFSFNDERFDIWHDRAVFHFLTDPASRNAYVKQVRSFVKPGGFVIMATFGPEGPTKCSGLDVIRYGAGELHNEFGDDFKLMGSEITDHQTPFQTNQQFMYCWCRME